MQDRAEHDDHDPGRDERDLGRDCQPVDRGGRDWGSHRPSNPRLIDFSLPPPGTVVFEYPGGRFSRKLVLSSRFTIERFTEGSMRSIASLGYRPRKRVSARSGAMTATSRKLTSGIRRLVLDGFPMKVRWNAQSMYTAARMTPTAPTMAHGRRETKVPRSDRNSPMNPENPGSPIPANMATRNNPVKIGAGRQIPPYSEIS